MSQIEVDLQRGQYIDPFDRTTVLEYATRWAGTRIHRPTTARRVSSLIMTHIAGTDLGARRLALVSPSEVQAWASDRAQVLAPTTLRNLVSLLRSVYASAVLDRLVASSPVVRLSLPATHRERVVPLSIAQVVELATAMPARNQAMVVAQAGLGLRIGELLSLRVQDVDFMRRSVRIEWQLAPGQKLRSAPKTRRSIRSVPLPQVVAEALSAHIATRTRRDAVHHAVRHALPARLLRDSNLRRVGGSGRSPDVDDVSRPPPPLRLGAAPAGRVGRRRGGAAGAPQRLVGALDLRAPDA